MKTMLVPFVLIFALMSAGCDRFDAERPMVSKISSGSSDAEGKAGTGQTNDGKDADPETIGDETSDDKPEDGEDAPDATPDETSQCIIPAPATEKF